MGTQTWNRYRNTRRCYQRRTRSAWDYPVFTDTYEKAIEALRSVHVEAKEVQCRFKRGAVEQASQPGVSCAQVAQELGIRDTLLTRWKRKPR